MIWAWTSGCSEQAVRHAAFVQQLRNGRIWWSLVLYSLREFDLGNDDGEVTWGGPAAVVRILTVELDWSRLGSLQHRGRSVSIGMPRP